MMRMGSLLGYNEILNQHPDWIFLRADLYFQEETADATERARIRAIRQTGYVLKFLQDHNLTRLIICATAPDIPDNLRVYLRDVTPEALDLYRTGYQKWCRRFERDMNADPSDVRILEKSLAEIRTRQAGELTNKIEEKKQQSKRTPSTKKPALKASVIASNLVKFVKYDDVSWHYEGKFPKDFPNEAGATHTGMFLAWALLKGLGSEDHTNAFFDEVSRLKQRKISPGAYFISTCDGKFTSDELSADGNSFARTYFNLQGGKYLHDYESLLAVGLPTTYHVPDTWDNFDKLKPLLDKRYADWIYRKSVN